DISAFASVQEQATSYSPESAIKVETDPVEPPGTENGLQFVTDYAPILDTEIAALRKRMGPATGRLRSAAVPALGVLLLMASGIWMAREQGPRPAMANNESAKLAAMGLVRNTIPSVRLPGAS